MRISEEVAMSGAVKVGETAAMQAVQRWKELTETILPCAAAEGHWPLRLDHCFKRVTLDNTFGRVWYDVLPRPAERHLTAQDAARAVKLAEAILTGGRPVLERLNANSLRWRGKASEQRESWSARLG